MSQSHDDGSPKRGDLTEAKQLLAEAIVILSANGNGKSAAHAQLALDLLDQEFSRLDPRLPD
jgi:hypothetical protein